jgi:ABC-type transport system involved in multi-copper enzyme maturation permease subunit
MRKFILKDFLLHKKFLLGFGPAYVVYMAIFGSRIGGSGVSAGFGPLLYALLPLTIYAREDKFKAEGFSLSLPMTRRDLILSRYIMAWITMLAMYGSASVLSVLIPGTKLSTSTIFLPKTVLMALFFMTLIFGMLMPLFTRFGMVGLMVFLIAMQVLGIFFVVFNMVIKDIRTVIMSTVGAINKVQAAIGPAGSAAAAVILMIMFTYLSFELSVFVFKRKDF